MNSVPHPQSSLRGFTLVELLVVVAVVAVLAVLTAAVVPNVLVSARATKCLSNMRQIGLAIQMYADDHHGDLPPTRHSSSETESWIFQLRDYLNDVDDVRICPADPNGPDRLARGGTSYILNDLIFDARTDPFGNVLPGSVGNMRRIDRPGRTIFGFIISDNRGVGGTNDHTHAGVWTSFDRFLSDVEADRHRRGSRHPDRSRGRANYLYADGTVRALTAVEMRDHIQEGHNPGQPGHAP